MSQITDRLAEIKNEISELQATYETVSATLITTSDDLTNITKIGRCLRDLATIAHSYDGVEWITKVLDRSAGRWGAQLDDLRSAMGLEENAFRNQRKKLKTRLESISSLIANLTRESESLTKADRILSREVNNA